LPDTGLALRVHDTLTGRKVRVDPGVARGRKLLRLYVCGITPYDSGHMGHAFTFCVYDILVRLVESTGVRVRYVQNITDVDDPLFERARRDGTDWTNARWPCISATWARSAGARLTSCRACRARSRRYFAPRRS
jgi:L-cysteine:1D-myo-inositol 2-amino-2-deoxy-alpha-D-glucopyranoside ligase